VSQWYHSQIEILSLVFRPLQQTRYTSGRTEQKNIVLGNIFALL
jgi:hypothetical protein